MTHATKQFVWVMRIFTFIYLVGGIMFFFMPDETFYLINVGPKVFKAFEEIPMPSERFWVALSTSMMAMLMVASFYSSIYPKLKGFVFIHIVSKSVSVAGFAYLFLRHRPYFAYLLGVVTDGSIILIVLGFYLRSLASGSLEAMPGAATPAPAAAPASSGPGDQTPPHGTPAQH